MKNIKHVLASSLVLFAVSSVNAEVTTQVTTAYINEAVATLEDNNIQSSDYYVGCTVDPTGTEAVCNAQANINNVRLSESMFCRGTFINDRYSQGTRFEVLWCVLRNQEDGSAK